MTLLAVLASSDCVAEGVMLLPETALTAEELGVIVNANDPLSLQIADYYQRRRGIPAENIVQIRLPTRRRHLGVKKFHALHQQMQASLPDQVQALALTWTRPYRVGCMSITTAFATGYDERYCAQKIPDRPCGVSGRSPYFASMSRRPYRDFGMRPTMMLAAENLEDAKRLIDRGLTADASFPGGTAYLLSTSDRNRTVRDSSFTATEQALSPLFRIQVLRQDSLRDAKDVMFYFTGSTHVQDLQTLRFLPGAVADHLTSAGGHMKPRGQSGQMSSLRWLEAGATGSYGTVIEPCNFIQKFPDPRTLMAFYLTGASLVEAYWKSVAWPGEGLFIGEPLAAPFFRDRMKLAGSSAKVPLNQFRPGVYRLQSAVYPVGPYRDTGQVLQVRRMDGMEIVSGLEDDTYYRLSRVERNGRAAGEFPLR